MKIITIEIEKTNKNVYLKKHGTKNQKNSHPAGYIVFLTSSFEKFLSCTQYVQNINRFTIKHSYKLLFFTICQNRCRRVLDIVKP